MKLEAKPAGYTPTSIDAAVKASETKDLIKRFEDVEAVKGTNLGNKIILHNGLPLLPTSTDAAAKTIETPTSNITSETEKPIVIEHLSKTYGTYVALKDLNLTVESGACVGFLGPNGAGKTTTIKILTDLLRATSGRAYLHGIDVIRDPKGALEGVGAVVETPDFPPQLTPRECLSYVGEVRGVSRDSIAERSHAVLEQVKLLEVIDKRTGEFSKGMKQRLAIAQALLHDPSILIFDEPTSGLDPRGMVEVRDIIRDLKRTDVTILMSSHLLNEVQTVCDKVAIIDRGVLLTYDSVQNLSKGRESQ